MYSFKVLRSLLLAMLGIATSGLAHAQFEGFTAIVFEVNSFNASPSVILAGESSTLSYTGRLVTLGCDVCLDSNTFTNQSRVSGPSTITDFTITISSGDGQTASPVGGPQVSFTYDTPGVYFPSISGVLHFTRPFTIRRLDTGEITETGVTTGSGGVITTTTRVTVLAVPEPETSALLLAGLGLLLFARVRRTHGAAA